MEKIKRKVKKRTSLAPWALLLLKITQHVSLCVAIISMMACILASSIYVEKYGYRTQLQLLSDIESSKSSYAEGNLYDKSFLLLRYVTIRSQLEVNGKFDRNKEINISEYCYRKADDYTGSKMMYFSEANFRLEDLLKWNQSAAISYLQEEMNSATTLEISNESIARSFDDAEYYGVSSTDVKYGFANADGVEIRYLANSIDEYKELLRQLLECIYDISYNYNEYLSLGKEFNRTDSNFVYYVNMGNAAGDIYSNIAANLMPNNPSGNAITEATMVEAYFKRIDYSAKGAFGMYDTYENGFDIFIEEIANLSGMYSYAFGEDAMVYMGYDFNLDADDEVKTIFDAYDNLDLKRIYILAAIMTVAGLYYVIILCYLMYASGRKVEENGEEYIELSWIDTIPLGLYLAWCVGLGVAAATLCVAGTYEGLFRYQYQYFEQWIIYVVAAASVFINVFVLETLLSLAKRVKSHTLFTNSFFCKYGLPQMKRFFSFIGKQHKKIVKKVQYYGEHSGRWEKTWGILLIEIVFTMMSIVVICSLLTRRNTKLSITAAIIYAFIVFVASFKRMIRKEERMDIVEKIEGIVAGEECRVEEANLSAENGPLGHAVNEIGEGIQNAVQISTRDEKLKAELLTNVSHDIKTPLTSIITYVDLLKKEQLENERAKEYIEVLESKSYKLKNLIQDLIEVSKISTGNIEYEMVPLNVHELMLQASGEYEERFKERCLKLVYSNDATETMIMADSRRMWRVLENLFTNVYKYALEGTRIYVEVTQDSGKLHICIKNISAKELSVKAEDLTERFVRGDLSRTTEGSGLGLAIAKNLVVGQGGQFAVSSDGDLFKVKVSFKIHIV